MIKMTRLENGLRVITDEMPSIHSASIGVWIKVGARHENQTEHGLAHLLEHMAFKGTQTRSAKDIAEQVENVGGIMNAYTGRDQTAYYMRVLSEDVELAADILGDILRHSVFDEEELHREKGVILQEIGECEDNPDEVLFDNLQDLCYPSQVLGRTILGTRESVTSLGRDNIQNYMNTHYVPENMIFAASGGVKHEHIVDLARQYMVFESRLSRTGTTPAKWGGGIREIKKDLEQLHLAFSLQGVSYFDPDYYISEVFSVLYGGGMSSRLFQEIREKRGLVYSISSFSSNLLDGGSFGVYAGTDPENAFEVLDASITEMEKCANYVSLQETERAKAQIRSGLMMGLESPSGRSETLVRQQFIFDSFISVEELLQKIAQVTPQDIQKYASRLLGSGKASYCVLGNTDRMTGNAEERLARFLLH